MQAVTLHGYNVGAERLNAEVVVLSLESQDGTNVIRIGLPNEIAAALANDLAGVPRIEVAPAGMLRKLRGVNGDGAPS